MLIHNWANRKLRSEAFTLLWFCRNKCLSVATGGSGFLVIHFYAFQCKIIASNWEWKKYFFFKLDMVWSQVVQSLMESDILQHRRKQIPENILVLFPSQSIHVIFRKLLYLETEGKYYNVSEDILFFISSCIYDSTKNAHYRATWLLLAVDQISVLINDVWKREWDIKVNFLYVSCKTVLPFSCFFSQKTTAIQKFQVSF